HLDIGCRVWWTIVPFAGQIRLIPDLIANDFALVMLGQIVAEVVDGSQVVGWLVRVAVFGQGCPIGRSVESRDYSDMTIVGFGHHDIAVAPIVRPRFFGLHVLPIEDLLDVAKAHLPDAFQVAGARGRIPPQKGLNAIAQRRERWMRLRSTIEYEDARHDEG